MSSASTGPNQKGAKKPKPAAPFSATQDQSHSGNHPRPTKERKHWLDYAIFGFVVVTAAATGFAAYYTKGERDGMVDQERRQLRAYVGVLPGDVEDFGSASQRLHLIRRNFGATPAYDVGFSEIGVAIEPVGAPLPAVPQGCAYPKMKLITMFPTTKLPLTFNIEKKFSGEQVLAVLAGKSELIFFGNVCYNDAFGQPHYTNYCWMYRGDSAHMTAKYADGCLGYNNSD